jgi:hypothetical protein
MDYLEPAALREVNAYCLTEPFHDLPAAAAGRAAEAPAGRLYEILTHCSPLPKKLTVRSTVGGRVDFQAMPEIVQK